MSDIRACLFKICSEWNTAKLQPFGKNQLAKFIRNDFVASIKGSVEKTKTNYIIKGSAGAGNWASVPWLVILNPLVTVSAEQGFYLVYLFKADGTGVYLSLNQGTTRPRELLGADAALVQSESIKKLFNSKAPRLLSWEREINLQSNTPLGRSYEPTNIAAKFYPTSEIPANNILEKDLQELLEISNSLVPEYLAFISPTKQIDSDGSENPIPQKMNEPYLFSTLPKPFLILAGISGTGKSRWVREQAKFSSNHDEFHKRNPDNFEIVPVRPDWHEPSDLLGYVSRISGKTEYVATDFLKFIVRAWKELPKVSLRPTKVDVEYVRPFWLCLDEMNMAPVEQYFADYLSILETAEWKGGQYSCDPIVKCTVLLSLQESGSLPSFWNSIGIDSTDPWSAEFLKMGIPLPPNLIVAGTVNMDETAHQFSRKVIDRALTLDFGEFFPNNYMEYGTQLKSKPKAFTFGTTTQATTHDAVGKASFNSSILEPEKSIKFLDSINSILKGTPFELAYRALNELLISVECFSKSDGSNLLSIWDDFLMMKVLPRIEGDEERLDGLLTKLHTKVSEYLFPINNIRQDLFREGFSGEEIQVEYRSPKKIEWMKNRLAKGYTSFWP